MWEQEYDPLIQEAARKHGVDPALIKAVIARESSGRPGAISSAGARGLMQLMPATAAELGVRDLHDPAQNIHGGTQYLSQLIKKYDGDVKKALVAYNAGPGNVARGTAPRSAWDYASRVLSTMPAAPPAGASAPQALPRATIEIPTIPQPQPAPAPAPPPMPRFSRQLTSPEGMNMPGISNILQNEEELTEDQMEVLADMEPAEMIGQNRVAMSPSAPGLVPGPVDTTNVWGPDTMTVTPNASQMGQLRDMDENWTPSMGWKEKLARIGVPLAAGLTGLLVGGGDSNASYALGGFAKGFAEDTHSRINEDRARARQLEDRALEQARKDYSELQGLDMNVLNKLVEEGQISSADVEDIQGAFRDYTNAIGKRKITPKDADRLSLAFHRIKSKMPGLEGMQKSYLEMESKKDALRRMGVPEDQLEGAIRRMTMGMTQEEYKQGGPGVFFKPGDILGAERLEVQEQRDVNNQALRKEMNTIKWGQLALEAQKAGIRADQFAAVAANKQVEMAVEALFAQMENAGNANEKAIYFNQAMDLIKGAATRVPGAPPGLSQGMTPPPGMEQPLAPLPSHTPKGVRRYNPDTDAFE